jgi:DNA-directed RNA polymerase sigma subunit (sigma70/sigma32)
MDSLNEREKHTERALIEEPQTLEELSRNMSARTRRIEVRAFEKLQRLCCVSLVRRILAN